MRSLKYMLLFCIATTLLLHSNGQDSLKTLSMQQVTEIVKRYHPAAIQADLRIGMAKADVLTARGNFDPLIQNHSAKKTFDGLDYYYYNRPELTIPSWFGIELSAGLEYLSGDRTDPSETKGKTSYLGISVPLARDLLMDKRRAQLQTAQIMREASETVKKDILNNLFFDAIKAYWHWTETYQLYQVIQEAVSLNEKRVQFVRTAFRMGDRPAIDTTEALAQLQQFEFSRADALLNFRKAGLELSVFLWTDSSKAYWLPETVVPADNLRKTAIHSFPVPELPVLLETAQRSNPALQLYDFKLDALAVEKKLKFQDLLPGIRLQYNQLGKGYDLLKTARAPLLENNFRYGISFDIPLRLSEGRGGYRKVKLEINETKLELSLKEQQLFAKVKGLYYELQTLLSQAALQEKIYQNNLSLQRGEEIRFQTGESSLFLVNSRENKTLDALRELQKLKAQYFKTFFALQWATGTLLP